MGILFEHCAGWSLQQLATALECLEEEIEMRFLAALVNTHPIQKYPTERVFRGFEIGNTRFGTDLDF